MHGMNLTTSDKHCEVVESFCNMCGLCVQECPAGAIQGGKKQIAKIMDDKCVKCGVCIESCPFDAIIQEDTHEKVEV